MEQTFRNEGRGLGGSVGGWLCRVLKKPFMVHVSVFLVLGGLVAAAYALFVNLPFLADDYIIVKGVILPAGGTDWGYVLRDFHGPLLGVRGLYRPLYTLLFGVDHALYGLNPAGYRITSLILHLVASFFVYLVALELARNGNARKIAITAGALFALYPVHAEPVVWIAGRVDVICAAFYLPALFFFLRWLRTEQRLDLALSLVFFILALMSKETAATLPGLLFLAAIYRGSGFKGAVVRVVPFAVVLGIYLLVRYYFLIEATPGGYLTGELRLLAHLYGFLYRTGHMFFPLNLALLGEWRPYVGNVLVLVPVVLVVACFLLARSRGRLPLLLLAFYSLGLVPVFTVLNPDPTLAQSRWSYIPSAFISILIAWLIWAVLERYRRLAVTAAMVVCVASFATLTANNIVWLNAGELSERILESEKKPEDFPVRYKGALVFFSETTWEAANSPPFNQQDGECRANHGSTDAREC